MKKAIILREPTAGKIFLTSSFSDVCDRLLPHLPADRAKTKLVFIETAANLYRGNRPWFDKERQLLTELGFAVTDLDVAGKTEAAVRSALDQANIIFVEGGNTIYLLEHAQKCNLGEIITEKIKSGTHYIGVSADSVIAGPDINLEKYFEDRTNAPELDSYAGFGLVPFLICPHWGSRDFEKEYLASLPEMYKSYQFPIVTITDQQFITVEEDTVKIY